MFISFYLVFFFKQKTAYEMRISDWSSDVCSSDLFWISAILGAVVFGLVLWIVPVSVLRTAGRFDFVGAAGLATGLLCVLLAISRGDEWGWTSPLTLGLAAAGVVVLVAWGWFELRVRDPLDRKSVL